MPIIKPDGTVEEHDTRGKTRGVYFNIERTRQHRELAGKRFYVSRVTDAGETIKEVYEVPDEITEFARDAVDFLVELIDTWESVPEKRAK